MVAGLQYRLYYTNEIGATYSDYSKSAYREACAHISDMVRGFVVRSDQVTASFIDGDTEQRP
jgi:hypothetical protein